MRPVRVLLVDDNPQFLESATTFLLANAGISVIGCAASGTEALEQVKDLQPDLVLMDVAMPGMDGIEAARRLKAEHEGAIRVVILTLHNISEYRAAAELVHADGFVTKSEFGTELLPLIDSMFEEAGPAESQH
jgi:DNA-binding NarL/FixJ family response regulator